MSDVGEEGIFEERAVPSTFWVLYGIAVFAVVCMGAAAFSVLQTLFQQGSFFDQLLLGSFFLAIPVLLAIGIKLAFLRKCIDFSGDFLTVGFRTPFRNKIFLKKTFLRQELNEFYLVNKRQSANLAKREHKDPRYHIRGHWRILLEVNGKRMVLDRHTEKESLEPLYGALKRWLGR